MPTSATKPSTPRLSEEARHFVLPTGIVATGWPQVVAKGRDLGIGFDWWQDSLGRAVLSKRKDGKYAATVGGIVLSIPRQVGKTFFVLALLVIMCILFPGLRVLWTAHHGRTATNSFRTLQGLCRRKRIAGLVESIRVANGEQEVTFKNGSMIMFGAREQGFGRGFDEIDVEVFDEAQILTEKALEDMVAATNQARHPHGALLFYMGTPPRPSDPGEAFALKRTRALAGRSDDMVYLECSAEPDADPDDRGQWAVANFSFPTRTPLESMLRLRENLGNDESWLREGLGIWEAAGSRQVIDGDTWRLQADPASMAIERLTLGVDVAPDRSMAAVSLAGQRFDERWHIELDEHRKGVDWVPAWLEARCERNQLHAVVLDELGGLVEKRNGRPFVVGTNVKVTLAAAEGRDMAIACARFFDGVMDGTVVHTDQPQVNVALSQATKRTLGAGWAWNRRTATSDITPITSATLALWGAQSSTVKKPSRGRRSEQRRAVVLA